MDFINDGYGGANHPATAGRHLYIEGISVGGHASTAGTLALMQTANAMFAFNVANGTAAPPVLIGVFPHG